MKAIPPRLFEEWRELYELEPWAEERSDLAAGITIMHNVAAHGAQAREPMKYMPFLRAYRREKPQSQEEMKAAFDAVCESMRRQEEAQNGGNPPWQA